VIVATGLCNDLCILHHFKLDLLGEFSSFGAIILRVSPTGDLFLVRRHLHPLCVMGWTICIVRDGDPQGDLGSFRNT